MSYQRYIGDSVDMTYLDLPFDGDVDTNTNDEEEDNYFDYDSLYQDTLHTHLHSSSFSSRPHSHEQNHFLFNRSSARLNPQPTPTPNLSYHTPSSGLVRSAAICRSFSLDDLRNTDTGWTSNRTCSICCEDYTATDTLAQLPCRHVFHSECSGDWLARFCCLFPVFNLHHTIFIELN
ncbi:hypothetical protein BLNAU_4181 [Blattamonas nauphoetae]|uniref:RING-type domain-containing protein n=1 Tax=Blattamonas nauphoetae TaxID=2049346 RepID=A0ABQ9YAZ5_9EUKA|nr:hypothetical protein BLNAU_4181 [Blattamonas nauphoetae]